MYINKGIQMLPAKKEWWVEKWSQMGFENTDEDENG